MKNLNFTMFILALGTVFVACDMNSVEFNRASKNHYSHQKIQNISHNNISENELQKAYKDELEAAPTEWEPRMIHTPSAQHHQPFYIPKESVLKTQSYFYDNVDRKIVKNKNLEEYDYLITGYTQYVDNSDIGYSFKKKDDEYFLEKLGFGSTYKTKDDFNDFNKEVIYKMLNVIGIKNPQIFFQELLDSPKITKYTGCIVQQKPVKYGVIDLTSCEEDNITALTLYNPEPAR